MINKNKPAFYDMAIGAGRPKKVGTPTETERERGRLVSAWIREGMSPPHQIVELSNADVARLTGFVPSSIGNYVNDCYDPKTDRMKFPSGAAMEKIAAALRIDLEKGLAARWWKPTEEQPGKSVDSRTRKIKVELPGNQYIEVMIPTTMSQTDIDKLIFAIKFSFAQ